MRKSLGLRDWQAAQRRARDMEAEGITVVGEAVTVPSAVRDVVFNVAAKFPMKRMEPGVEYQGLPMDVEGFVKQIEHDLGVG